MGSFQQVGLGQTARRALIVLAATLVAVPLHGVVCDVPSEGYPSIGSAVSDPLCDTIQLAAGNYPESVLVSRDVTILGAGSTATLVNGGVRLQGAGVDVTLGALRIQAATAGCAVDPLEVAGGAQLTSALDLDVQAGGAACLLFADGFESGTTGAWAAVAPP